MFDTILAGGDVIDGTGAPRYQADVGLQAGKITTIGSLNEAVATTRIDARGQVVCPGFIDVHNHSDGWLLRDPDWSIKTVQGYTTEILMSDGLSYAPVDEQTWREWFFYQKALNGLSLTKYSGWRTWSDYMSLLDGRSSQNSAALVPYANVRSLVCGFGRHAPDDLQQQLIGAELRRCLDDGAVGLSTGLDYIAQCFASTDELVMAAKALHGRGLPYVTHIRYKLGLLEGLGEAIEIGRRAAVPVHISHLKSVSGVAAQEVLGLLDQAETSGVEVTFDIYPYQPGCTMLNYLLPYEVWEHGPLAALEQLSRPVIQERFRRHLEAFRLPLDRLQVAWLPSVEHAGLIGKSLAEVADLLNLPPADAMLRLLIEERLAVLLVFVDGDDTAVYPYLSDRRCMVGSDGIYFPGSRVHPRVSGSAPRIIGPLVRDAMLFSLESAVHKLTGYPAQRFRLADRGQIRVGAAADIVVFDPHTVTDRATYQAPLATPTGLSHVLVNGTPVLSGGQPVDHPTLGEQNRLHRSSAQPGHWLKAERV